MGADRDEDQCEWGRVGGDVLELCPEVSSPVRQWYGKYAAARVKAARGWLGRTLAWRPSETQTLVVFVLLTLAGIRWMWTHPTQLRNGVEQVQRLPKILESHLEYSRFYFGTPLQYNTEPPFPFAFTVRDAEEEWLPQIYADLRKFVNPPALGVVQADFVHEKHPDIVGHVNRSIDGILRLVNGTTGIAPCAIRMVYLFRSHLYYDDRGAVFCEQPGAASHLPLLDRHLRSVVRYASSKAQQLPNVRFLVSTSEFGLGETLFNNNTMGDTDPIRLLAALEARKLKLTATHPARKQARANAQALGVKQQIRAAKARPEADIELFDKFPVFVFAKQGGLPTGPREGDGGGASNPQLAAYQAKIQRAKPTWSLRNTRGVLAPNIAVGDLESYERNLNTVRAIASENEFALRKPVAYWRGRCSRDRAASWARIQTVGLSRVFPAALDAAMTAACELSLESEAVLTGPDATMVRQLAVDTHRTSLAISRNKYLLAMPSSVSNCSLGNQGLWAHGSVVLRWDSPCEEWYSSKIREDETHLTVDQNNLITRIDYLQNHEDEARRLAEAGKAMWRKFLSPDSIMAYWLLLLTEYQKIAPNLEVTDYRGDYPLPKFVCTCDAAAVPVRAKCSFCEHWVKERVKEHKAVDAYMFHHGYT